MDLFLQKKVKKEKAKFNLLVRKVNIIDGHVDFQDDIFSPAFTKSLDNLDMSLALSLPVSVRFNFKCVVLADPAAEIGASGEFNIAQKQLTSKIDIRNLASVEFLSYYQNLGISFYEGTINALINLELKDNIVSVHLDAKTKGLNLSKDKILANLNSTINSDFKYNLKDKQLAYSGKATIAQSNVSGLEFIGEISSISGEIGFNNSGLSADKIKADVLGIPVEAKLSLTDFNRPMLNVNILAGIDFNSIQKTLKDKFKLAVPADIKGNGKLSVMIASRIPFREIPQINGYLNIVKAIVKLDKINSPIEDVTGKLEFNQRQLQWSGINFKYQGIPYSIDGTLVNFLAPRVKLELSSKDLSLESMLTINKKLIELVKLKGRYINSEFLLGGRINLTSPGILQTAISGRLNINLKDIKEPLKKFQNQLQKIKPEGIMQVKFNLKGNLNDFKSCKVEAEVFSSSLSACGLKSQESFLNYRQADGILEIPFMHLSLYNGTIKGSGAMNMNAEHLPYQINLDAKDIKIEKLKLDTPIREKDIAGTIQAQVKLNGYSGDFSKLNGAGKILITDGKLWQLNLFQGLGKLIFAEDFANIIFSEGYCGFVIQDKFIFTDNLKLKSKLAELGGTAKIGFDSSVDASIKVRILGDMIPLTSTLKDITQAIIGEIGVFGVIKISGTLEQPKYKFQPAVVDVIKGLKDLFE